MDKAKKVLLEIGLISEGGKWKRNDAGELIGNVARMGHETSDAHIIKLGICEAYWKMKKAKLPEPVDAEVWDNNVKILSDKNLLPTGAQQGAAIPSHVNGGFKNLSQGGKPARGGGCKFLDPKILDKYAQAARDTKIDDWERFKFSLRGLGHPKTSAERIVNKYFSKERRNQTIIPDVENQTGTIGAKSRDRDVAGAALLAWGTTSQRHDFPSTPSKKGVRFVRSNPEHRVLLTEKIRAGYRYVKRKYKSKPQSFMPVMHWLYNMNLIQALNMDKSQDKWFWDEFKKFEKALKAMDTENEVRKRAEGKKLPQLKWTNVVDVYPFLGFGSQRSYERARNDVFNAMALDVPGTQKGKDLEV